MIINLRALRGSAIIDESIAAKEIKAIFYVFKKEIASTGRLLIKDT